MFKASTENDKLHVGEKEMQAKHPSDVIGDWGPIQRRIVLICMITYFVAPFNNMAIIFWIAKYDFYCNYQDPSGSIVTLKNECNYKLDGVNHKCSNFTYETSVYKRTLVSEFDLVCDRAYFGSLAQSMHQFGYMVSGNLIGFISDRYGRLFSVKLSLILEILAGFAQAFAPSIYWFMGARFFVGIAAYGRFLSCFVLTAEWVGPKIRPQTTIVYEFGYAFANIFVPFCFWLNTDYFAMQTTVSTIEVIMLLIFWLTVWESPRWLLTQGRYDKAEEHLRAAAKANNSLHDAEIDRRIKDLRINYVKQFEEERASEKKREGLTDVWKVPALLKLSLILYYTWLTFAFIGYGSAFNIGSLGGSIFISYTISALSSLTTNILMFFIIDRFPRKKFIMSCMAIVVTTLSLLILFSLDALDYYVVRVVIYFIYNGARSATSKIYYLYTTETFPTTMRQINLGTCSFFARIGSTTAPFVKELTAATHYTVVLGIFMGMVIVNLLLFAFVPETGDIQLPDTMIQKKKEVELRRMSRVSQVST